MNGCWRFAPSKIPGFSRRFRNWFLTMTAWTNMMPSHATSYLGSKQFFRSMYGVSMYARRCRRPLSCPTGQGIPTNGCSCALPRTTAIQAAWFPFPNEVIIWYGITRYYTIAVMALYLVCLDPWQGWADIITTYSTVLQSLHSASQCLFLASECWNNWSLLTQLNQ